MAARLGTKRALTLGKGVGFTPAANFTASGVVDGLWHDASDISTLSVDTAGATPVTADGDAIGRFLDKSPYAHSFAQPTGTFKALYKTAAGLSWAQFDGSDDFYSGGDVCDPLTYSYYCITGARITGAAGALFAKSIAAAGTGRYGVYRNANTLQAIYDPNGTPTVGGNAADSSTANRVITQRLDRAAGTNKMRVNGVAFGTAANFTPDGSINTTYRHLMGAYNDGTDTGILFPLNGRIYARIMVMIAGAITAEHDALITKTEQWMAGKCGITI